MSASFHGMAYLQSLWSCKILQILFFLKICIVELLRKLICTTDLMHKEYGPKLILVL